MRRVLEGVEEEKDNYIKELTRGEMVNWAIRGLYRRLEENVPTEVKDRLEKAKDLKPNELRTLLADVRERLGQREDLDDNKDVDMSLQMMMSNLDPYTTYIDENTKKKAEIQFTGIGIQIRRDLAKDVVRRHADSRSPAYRAGFKAGDLITQIESNMNEKVCEDAWRRRHSRRRA